MLTLKFLNLCLKLLLCRIKILNLSPPVIIVILLVILGQIILSWGLCLPLKLDLLLGNRVVLKLLMFVTIVVLQVTLVLIDSNCFLTSECPIGLILCLKVLYLFGELLKALSFLTQFQGNSNSSMSFSSHTRTCAFSSSRPKTCAVWVIKDPKT